MYLIIWVRSRDFYGRNQFVVKLREKSVTVL